MTNKLFKRTISCVVSLLMILVSIVCVSAETTTGSTTDGFNYSIADGEVTITGYEGSASEVVIPDTIEGLLVTVIGESAFYGNYSMVSVVVPDTVTKLERYSFESCGNLESVTLSDNLTDIGESAFGMCDRLRYLELPESLISIGPTAFNYSIEELHIPKNVRYLSGTSLSYLNDVTIDEENKYYTCVDSVVFSKDMSTLVEFIDPFPHVETYSIPDSVTSIGPYAFCGADFISVHIPDSVVTVGDHAFFACPNLTEVTLPDSVVTVGDSAFYGCDNLSKVKLSENLSAISNLMFCDCGKLGNITLPGKLSKMGFGVFSRTPITEITIPASVTYIEPRVLMGCTTLKEVTVEEGNSIYYSEDGVLFYSLDNWQDSETKFIHSYPSGKTDKAYTIPDGVNYIDPSCFMDNTYLETVYLPSSVCDISAFAFSECQSLNAVYIYNSDVCFSSMSFDECNSSMTIYGYDGSTAEEFCTEYGYNFCSLGEIPVVKPESGDVNGDGKLSIMDVTYIQMFLADLEEFSDEQKMLADYNQDGKVNIMDATQIQLFLANLITE